MNSITVSIVSHDHGVMVLQLLEQLSKYANHIARVVVTHNIEGDESPVDGQYQFEVVNIQNQKPLGFGANHNQAFQYCETAHFCVMNPDIYLESDPFELLLFCLGDSSVSVVAPTIINLDGVIEDSARYFPSPTGLIRKLFSSYDGVFPVLTGAKEVYPDWVAGMFLLLPSERYRELSGFDEEYFLYYEDVDLCARSWGAGYKVVLCTEALVVHDARRTSHSNLKYLKWHLASIFRFFRMFWGRLPSKHA